METEVSVVLEGPEQMALREFEIPTSVGPYEGLLRVECVSVCGTDVHIYRNEIEGHCYPLIMGHEYVGRLVAVGQEMARLNSVKVGDRVTPEPYVRCNECSYCLEGNYHLCRNLRDYGFNIPCDQPPHLFGAYGEYVFLMQNVRLHKVAPGVPVEAAALSSVVGNGVRWVRTRGRVQFGESVVIIGPGAQGLCSVAAAAEAGAEPIIVLGLPRDATRLRLAEEFGAHHTVDIGKGDPVKRVTELTHGNLADAVIECSGAVSAMQLSFDLVRPLGRIVLIGLNGGKSVPLVTDRLIWKEVKVIAGRGQAGDVELAMRLINSRRYPFERIITHTFPLNRAEEALRFYMAGHPECTKVALVPGPDFDGVETRRTKTLEQAAATTRRVA